jgi:hypothetical protein
LRKPGRLSGTGVNGSQEIIDRSSRFTLIKEAWLLHLTYNFNGLSGLNLIVFAGCGELTQQLKNFKRETITLVSQPTALKKMMKIINRWPLALIILGGALTLAWIALLIWFPLHLLRVM